LVSHTRLSNPLNHTYGFSNPYPEVCFNLATTLFANQVYYMTTMENGNWCGVLLLCECSSFDVFVSVSPWTLDCYVNVDGYRVKHMYILFC